MVVCPAPSEHLKIIRQGVDAWNEWRKQNPELKPDLRKADLRPVSLEGADLRGADLWMADLEGAKLHGADLRDAHLWWVETWPWRSVTRTGDNKSAKSSGPTR